MDLPYHLKSTQVHLPIDNEKEQKVQSVSLVQYEHLLILLTNTGSLFVSLSHLPLKLPLP